MFENDRTSYNWPNGRKSVAGGTRVEIKLDRPWQTEIKVNPENCPFCTRKQNDLKVFDEEGGWRLIENAFTPYRVNDGIHRMLIPLKCWSIEELRNLGGEKKLFTAFNIIQSEVNNYKDRVLWINFHIGYQAGQNVPHLHFHIVQYSFDSEPNINLRTELTEYYKHSGIYQHLVFLEDSRCIFGIGGTRAGQCFILPKEMNVKLPELSVNLFKLVYCFNQKFKSKQGLAPDYNVSIVMTGGNVLHGLYTPILNNWGSAEALAFYDASAPLSMPWTHEKTAEHLRA